MDPMTMTPDRRLHATRMYGRAADAFDAVAWKPPEARRFSAVTANDGHPSPSILDELRALPRWVVIASGGAFSAFLGMMMGAAFRL
ncbi:MAG: hypothetical protein KJ676_04780 [Alphaproteobacteria bacterium]|nr:hypothetical protein [Alphaproteobacteria bacterium]